MKSKGYPVHQLMFGATSQTELDKGTFVVPTAIELPNLDDLQREVLVRFYISLPISMVSLNNSSHALMLKVMV